MVSEARIGDVCTGIIVCSLLVLGTSLIVRLFVDHLEEADGLKGDPDRPKTERAGQSGNDPPRE